MNLGDWVVWVYGKGIDARLIAFIGMTAKEIYPCLEGSDIEAPIYPLNFQQQIIAVPPGAFALSQNFFARLMNESTNVIDQWIAKSKKDDQRISDSYVDDIDEMNLL